MVLLPADHILVELPVDDIFYAVDEDGRELEEVRDDERHRDVLAVLRLFYQVPDRSEEGVVVDVHEGAVDPRCARPT